MAFIRTKTVRGRTYFYRVENHREDGKVKQTILEYFGTTPPADYVVPTSTRRRVSIAGVTTLPATPVTTAPGDNVVSTSTTRVEEPVVTSGRMVVVRFTDSEFEVVAARAAGKNLSPGFYLKWLATQSHKKRKA